MENKEPKKYRMCTVNMGADTRHIAVIMGQGTDEQSVGV